MTKKEQGFYNAYCNSSYTDLWQVYGTWSRKKQKAFDWCREKCYQMRGYDLRITAAGCQFFTVAWRYEKDDATWLNVETYANTYQFKIPD